MKEKCKCGPKMFFCKWFLTSKFPKLKWTSQTRVWSQIWNCELKLVFPRTFIGMDACSSVARPSTFLNVIKPAEQKCLQNLTPYALVAQITQRVYLCHGKRASRLLHKLSHLSFTLLFMGWPRTTCGNIFIYSHKIIGDAKLFVSCGSLPAQYCSVFVFVWDICNSRW